MGWNCPRHTSLWAYVKWQICHMTEILFPIPFDKSLILLSPQGSCGDSRTLWLPGRVLHPLPVPTPFQQLGPQPTPQRRPGEQLEPIFNLWGNNTPPPSYLSTPQQDFFPVFHGPYFSWYIYILSSTNFIITSIIQKSWLLSLLHLSSGGSSCGGHSQVPGVLRSPHLCSLETGSAEEENPNLFSSSDWSRLLQRCAPLLLASLTRCSRVIQRLHSIT